MEKFTKIATVAVMTMVTAGVFAGCGLKGGKDIGKEAALEAALSRDIIMGRHSKGRSMSWIRRSKKNRKALIAR